MDKIETCKKFEWRKVDPDGDLPLVTEDRFGCSATMVGHYLWVIGSYTGSEFTLLDLKKKAWMNIPGTAKDFKFMLHSASLHEDTILLYGAEVAVGDDLPNEHVHELVVFDLLLKEVEIIPTYGGNSRPARKESHTADICETENLLVVFGGIPFPSRAQDQLYLLDLSSWTWSLPDSKGKPPSLRERHASLMVGSKLFIYSGDEGGLETNTVPAELYTVDINRNAKLSWQQVVLRGEPKFERIGAGLQYVGNGRAIIFGGYSFGDTNDLLVVENILSTSPVCHEVVSRSNSPYSYAGKSPSAREAPRMVLNQGKLIIIGGSGQDQSSYFELLPA